MVLTPTGPSGEVITLTAPISNLSTVSAYFPVPPSVPPGEYMVSVSNGAASSQLRSFRNAGADGCRGDSCYVRSIRVRPAAATAFPTRRFAVSDYGCTGGATHNCTTNGMGCAIPVNATAAVHRAIAAAGEAGGGTVFFDVGRWYIRGQGRWHAVRGHVLQPDLAHRRR